MTILDDETLDKNIYKLLDKQKILLILYIMKKILSNLVKHKYTLYIMYALVMFNLYNYYKYSKFSCAFITLGVFMLSNKFLTKNKSVSIFVAIFLTNFVFGCNKLIEGHYPGDPDWSDEEALARMGNKSEYKQLSSVIKRMNPGVKNIVEKREKEIAKNNIKN
jgi:hypothetical protein